MQQKSINIKDFSFLLRMELLVPQRGRSDSETGGASAALSSLFSLSVGRPGDGGTCSQEFPGPGESAHVSIVLPCISVSSKNYKYPGSKPCAGGVMGTSRYGGRAG